MADSNLDHDDGMQSLEIEINANLPTKGSISEGLPIYFEAEMHKSKDAFTIDVGGLSPSINLLRFRFCDLHYPLCC